MANPRIYPRPTDKQIDIALLVIADTIPINVIGNSETNGTEIHAAIRATLSHLFFEVDRLRIANNEFRRLPITGPDHLQELDAFTNALRAWTETPVFSPESHEGSVAWSVIEQWTERARAETKAVLRMKP